MTHFNTRDFVVDFFEFTERPSLTMDEDMELINETSRRTGRFFQELKEKRDYSDFKTFKSDNDEMIISNSLKVFSYCEHHLLPFIGECSIGYLPRGKILGLSKFQRLVDKYASKPTLQETITVEIAKAIEDLLDPMGVGVIMKCIHCCIFARGVKSQSEFLTSSMRGNFKEKEATRNEFLSLANVERRKL